MARIRTLGRIQYTSRTQFIWPHGLFAIFEKTVFWGGLKPPLLLFVSGTNEEDDHVASSDWEVWIQRAFFWLYVTNTNFPLCYLFFIQYTTRWSSSVGGMLCWQALGPGFDSQVPSSLHIIFLTMFACSALSRYPPYVHNPGAPHVSESQSKGQDLKNTMGTSQCIRTWPEKSNKALKHWA